MFWNTISKRQRLKKVIVTITSVVALVYILAPVYWVFVSGFQKEIALEDRPPHFVPTQDVLTLNHYYFLFTGKIPPGSTIMLQSMYTMTCLLYTSPSPRD